LRWQSCSSNTGSSRWRAWPHGSAYPGRVSQSVKKIEQGQGPALYMVVARHHPRPTS
jgi:hypothetical protein